MTRSDDPFNALVPFLGPEEKDLALLDRPSDCVAVIVPTELVLGASCRAQRRGAAVLQNGVIRIQLIVASGIVDAAVKIIRTRLGYQINRRAGHAAEFSAVAAALNFELLDRLG